MKRLCLVFLGVVGFLILAWSEAVQTENEWTLQGTLMKGSGVIAFEVLRQWEIPNGGMGIDILVSEEATKEEVLTLAHRLRAELSEGGSFIQIFDSKEAHLHQLDENYPEEEYAKHFLVQITRNPKTGYDQIEWMAKGRNH